MSERQLAAQSCSESDSVSPFPCTSSEKELTLCDPPRNSGLGSEPSRETELRSRAIGRHCHEETCGGNLAALLRRLRAFAPVQLVYTLIGLSISLPVISGAIYLPPTSRVAYTYMALGVPKLQISLSLYLW
ncbi:hypothetical protein CC79DRAFT_191958 [Sarocladium strictum]